MTEPILVIHVLNKNSLGGAESLVKSLVNQPKSREESLAHKIFFIAPSQVSVKMLGVRLLRFIPILTASIRLIIFARRCNRLKIKTAIIFHLAECHIVAKFCGFMISTLPNIKVIIYLHQSRELFPRKISWITESLICKYESICYSESATKSWFSNPTLGICKKTIIHNPVGIKGLGYRNPQGDTLNLLFIGRFTPWKRPDMAIAIASKLAGFTQVNLKIVGFNKSDFVGHYGEIDESNSSLSIEFLGSVSDVVPMLQGSDLLLNLAESDLSGECIGIAALESLSLGVPVLVQNCNMSDFQNMPGIYSLVDFESLTTKMLEDTQPTKLFRNSFKIAPEVRVSWEEKTSLDRYNKQLLLLLHDSLDETRCH